MKKWVVITQDDCLYCTRARRLLQDIGEFNVITLNVKDHPGLKTFIQAQGLTTVPQIYCEGEWIGGFDDLVTSVAEGGL